MKDEDPIARHGRRPGRRIPLALAVLVPLLFAGCATIWDYNRPGGTPEQARRDLGLCGVNFNAAGQPMLISEDQRNRVNRCMQRRGYTVVRRGG